MSEQVKPTSGPWVWNGADAVWNTDGSGSDDRPQIMVADLKTAVLSRYAAESQDERHANGKLIAEAGTVYHETGLSPRQLAEQREELLEALRGLCDWFGLYPAGKLPIDQWECLAEEFRIATGFLRIGKDYPAGAELNKEQEEERLKLWLAWSKEYKNRLVQRAASAIANATAPVQGQEESNG